MFLFKIQRKYKGTPAREARREFVGFFIQNAKGIQRKSGARSAPADFEVFLLGIQRKQRESSARSAPGVLGRFTQKYKGNTKVFISNPAREARRNKSHVFYSKCKGNTKENQR